MSKTPGILLALAFLAFLAGEALARGGGRGVAPGGMRGASRGHSRGSSMRGSRSSGPSRNFTPRISGRSSHRSAASGMRSSRSAPSSRGYRRTTPSRSPTISSRPAPRGIGTSRSRSVGARQSSPRTGIRSQRPSSHSGIRSGGARTQRTATPSRSYRRGFQGSARTSRALSGRGRYGFAHRSASARAPVPGRTRARHDYYRRNGINVSFRFGGGWYGGSSCYHPYRRWGNWCDYGFFYPRRVSYCYVPYGFYWGYDPVYITRTVYVRDEYPIREYGTEELPAELAEPPLEGEVVEPQPAAGSPATERFLREASEAFREADYATAADKFRLAAISASDQAGPLFAFGQALLALGKDDYAARVMRAAFRLDEKLPAETGDIAGVYKDAAEFDRVLRALEARAASSPAGSDARFLLAVQRYFTGDPRARRDFTALAQALPEDDAVALFRMAVEERFRAEEELPPR